MAAIAKEAAIAGYVIEPGISRFNVRGFAGGLLSGRGHNPVIAVPDFMGDAHWDPGAPDEVPCACAFARSCWPCRTTSAIRIAARWSAPCERKFWSLRYARTRRKLIALGVREYPAEHLHVANLRHRAIWRRESR